MCVDVWEGVVSVTALQACAVDGRSGNHLYYYYYYYYKHLIIEYVYLRQNKQSTVESMKTSLETVINNYTSSYLYNQITSNVSDCLEIVQYLQTRSHRMRSRSFAGKKAGYTTLAEMSYLPCTADDEFRPRIYIGVHALIEWKYD